LRPGVHAGVRRAAAHPCHGEDRHPRPHDSPWAATAPHGSQCALVPDRQLRRLLELGMVGGWPRRREWAARIAMPRLRVLGYSISLDGYGAGPRQSRQEPLGVGGESLHAWLVQTRTFKQTYGEEGGAGGVDDDFAARGFAGIGA